MYRPDYGSRGLYLLVHRNVAWDDQPFHGNRKQVSDRDDDDRFVYGYHGYRETADRPIMQHSGSVTFLVLGSWFGTLQIFLKRILTGGG
jgi:hypothetical protein